MGPHKAGSPLSKRPSQFIWKFINVPDSKNILILPMSMVLVGMLLQMKAMHLAHLKGPSVPYKAVSARGQMNVQIVEVSRVKRKPVV